MNINTETRYLARLHTKASPFGLNIYNPFLEEINANVLYMLFYNDSPKLLIDGIRNLKFIGAISAGFEKNPDLPPLLDEIDEYSQFIGRVGYIKNVNGKLIGSSQGGRAIYTCITSKGSLRGKVLTIVGAGHLTKQLLWMIEREKTLPKEIHLYNRTISNAEQLASQFNLPIQVSGLDALPKAEGDILIDNTDIEDKSPDNLFTEIIVNNHNIIFDATYTKKEVNIIKLAKKLNKTVLDGFDMFTSQGAVVMSDILGEPVDYDILNKHVRKGLWETAT